jgi:hypothetical protein
LEEVPLPKNMENEVKLTKDVNYLKAFLKLKRRTKKIFKGKVV